MKDLKFDKEKIRVDLFPLEFVEEVSKVLTFGASKYEADSWKTLQNAEKRYYGALLRHLIAIEKGEEFDPESGLPHLSHAACNMVFLMFFYLKNKKN